MHRNLLLCANFFPLELEDEDESLFDESTEQQSEASEGATWGSTRDRASDWVPHSPPAHPSDFLDADNRFDHVELEGSASQRPKSVPSVVGGMPSISCFATASRAVSRIRTRVGRLLKPADRLMQNMTQKLKHSAP